MNNIHWKKMPLGDFVTLQRGHDLPASARKPGNIPVMGSAGLTGYHNKAVMKGPGVTIGRSGVGSMGVVSYCQEDYWPHNTVLYVTDFKGNYPLFVYYLLKSMDLRSYDSGSAQSSLNRNYLYPTIISVPHPEVQMEIADLLFSLDNKIELNKQINITAGALISALYKSWFIDFLPVKAKMEKGDNVFASSLLDLFPDSFVDSELGEIPTGWRIANLGDEDIFPLVLPGIQVDEIEKVSYIATGDVTYGTITNETEGYIRSLPSRANMQPGYGRVWFAKMKDSRKYLWTMEEDNNWWSKRVLSTGFAGIQTTKTIYEAYLYSYISSDAFEEEKNRLAIGTTMQAINTDTIKSISLVVPPESVVISFDEIVRPIHRKIQENFLESRTLASLRDSLLPKLMRGEVRVKGIEH